jgi:hypothetical protein
LDSEVAEAVLKSIKRRLDYLTGGGGPVCNWENSAAYIFSYWQTGFALRKIDKRKATPFLFYRTKVLVSIFQAQQKKSRMAVNSGKILG